MSRIIVRREDCRRAFFRGTGPGGQHRNKTETCVRYVHLPTGIQAEGKSERSRDANDKFAWGLLLGKIEKMEDNAAAQQALEAWLEKPDAAFGSQVRSYVFDGNARRVVDHVTGHHSTDPAGVVGRGKLDGFLRAAMEGRRS